jgi:hypothetical protein
MSKRKRGISSAATRKQAMAAVSGVKREKPRLDQPLSGKGRKARRGVVVYLHPLAKDLLKRIALEHRRTIQDLGVEAFNRLFLAYGEKPIG